MYEFEHNNALRFTERLYILFLLIYFKLNGMSSTTSIIILASQARSNNQHKNLRSKVLKCSTNIHFNRQCLEKNLTLLFSTEYIHTHTHTHTYIYIYIYVCVCVCVCVCVWAG